MHLLLTKPIRRRLNERGDKIPPHKIIKKLIVVPNVSEEATYAPERVALFYPDGTPIIFEETPGPKGSIQLKSPDNTVYNITVTNDGTLDVAVA